MGPPVSVPRCPGRENDPGLCTAAPRLLLSVQSCPSGAGLPLQGPPGLPGLYGELCEGGCLVQLKGQKGVGTSLTHSPVKVEHQALSSTC